MNTTVTLRPVRHRKESKIGIFFQHDLSLNILIRTKADGKWSQSNKCWCVPLDRTSYEKIKAALPAGVKLDTQELKLFLENERKSPVKTSALAKRNTPVPVRSKAGIAPVNKHVLPAMLEMLKLKAYSPSTIRTYLNEMAQLLQAINEIPADELKPEHLKRYLVYCYEKLGLKENTLHSRINAMKLYYEQVLKREKFFWEIPRPKKQIQLPKIFNQDEIAQIIKAIKSIKHKTMLMLAYSAGLRASEVVTIRTADIDSKRMCIFIRQAKGKKDRVVRLSPLLLVMLREYWKTGKASREGYLFPGQNKGEPYSTRSLQLVLAAAKERAGIIKPGSVHALRHSFATHLLDKGTDVTMIMKLLGHNSIRTTLRYLHLTNRDMLQIMSPLDDLDLS